MKLKLGIPKGSLEAATIDLFKQQRILLAVPAARRGRLPKSLNETQLICFKTALLVQQVLDRLNGPIRC